MNRRRRHPHSRADHKGAISAEEGGTTAMGEETRQAKRAKRASMPAAPARSTSPPMASVASTDNRHATPTRRAESEEIQTEATSSLYSEDRMRSMSPSDRRNGASSASIYAPSRFPRRLQESRPKFTVVGDSLLEEGSIDLAASTRSLMEQYLDYNEENGRRYCSTYFMPNDELEQTRMYLTHQVYLQMFNGEPTTAPLEDPRLILDIGTGTGDWATQVGERYPECEVVGTDISAIQSACPPFNVFFEIEDAELPWLRQPDSVDLIHMRNMAGAFRDWRFIYEQAFECLRPGGWMELQDFAHAKDWSDFFAVFPPDAIIHKLAQDLYVASVKSGRPRGSQHLDEGYLIEAGFVDVETQTFEIPIATETGAAGKIWLIAAVDGLEALCLRPLTKYMGWDPEECKKACNEAAHQIARYAKDPEKAQRMLTRIRVVRGRKPDSPEVWDAYHACWQEQGLDPDLEGGSNSERTSMPGERTPAVSIAERTDEEDARGRAGTVTPGDLSSRIVGEAMDVDETVVAEK